MAETADRADEQHRRPFEQELFVNMGPQHPSTHGVLRVLLTLDGEKVLEAEAGHRLPAPVLREDRREAQALQVIPYTDRTDYLAAITNEWAS